MFFRKTTEDNQIQEALPLELCYAKTVQDTDGTVVFGLPVLYHCIIVGEVARALLSYFPQSIRNIIFPSGVTLIAACHDVGKVNPMFMKKIYQAVEKVEISHYPALKDARIDLEKSTGCHAGVSQVTFQHDYPYIASIVGRHHGANPKIALLPDDPILGGKPWFDCRQQLFKQLQEYFQETFPTIDSFFHASAIAGLVAVADWIGSGTVFQNLKSIELESVGKLASEAIHKAGFIEPKIRKGLSFKEVFGFAPRETQSSLIDMIDKPGTYILEALMGEGKTEAALYGAYKMLEQGFAPGIYFALPTKLTSEKMYERVQDFLQRILEDCETKHLHLLHGSSWLLETELGEEGSIGHSWFDTNKRKILAPFAVGTLDQALLSVLNVKHGFVRSFGLAGKVVILDEIHSYDAYTGTLVQYLVKELEQLGCTVILLSATLTSARKEEILDVQLSHQSTRDPYPQIIRKVGNQLQSCSPKGPKESTCSIHCESSTELVIARVRQAALEGAQVLWIENAVSEAQAAFKQYAAWAAEADVEVGLVHSRFPSERRTELENHWVGLYGKHGSRARKVRGRILFGTQVLEQSLDIDADLLITKLAPSDMLLQRMGRLWRHADNDSLRPAESSKEMIVLVPDVFCKSFNVEFGFGPSGAIYAPYVLWRTYQEWIGMKTVTIPADMRRILESTYAEQSETGSIAKTKIDVLKRKEILQLSALNSMALAGETYAETSATRYSDITTCPVLLLTKEPYPGSLTRYLLDGSSLDVSLTSIMDTKAIIKKLMQTLIHVPYYIAPRVQTPKELAWLKPFFYISEDEKERIRVAILDESGLIRAQGGLEANDDYFLTYSHVLGYGAKKKREE